MRPVNQPALKSLGVHVIESQGGYLVSILYPSSHMQKGNTQFGNRLRLLCNVSVQCEAHTESPVEKITILYHWSASSFDSELSYSHRM
jgi:hypothetical protein